MSGLLPRGGSLSFPPVQGFSAPNLSAHRHSVSEHSPSNFHNNLSECDTDMVDTMPGANTTMMNATSPEDDNNEDDGYGTKKDARLEMNIATIPEYFAHRKTKGRFHSDHHLTGTNRVVDGKIPKKRGPKPDSKPARDRRQELNRQAQRMSEFSTNSNHRQRKEDNQKMLEEALAEAAEKATAAMKRTQAAEKLQQHMIRGHEHLLRENERLKQLLNVNKIPFEHAIPQQPTLNVESVGPAGTIQQRGDLVLTNLTSHNINMNKGTSVPGAHAAMSPTSGTSAFPLFAKSSPSDITLSGMSLDSSSPPISPMDSANGIKAEGGSGQTREYNPARTGHQPILHIDKTVDALSGKPSGSFFGQAPAAASVPDSSRTPSYPESSNSRGGPTYQVSSSINTDRTLMDPTKDTPLPNNPYKDPFAIPDHDQAGAEFILALEANCHDHKTLMNARTFNDPVQLGGHSLMLTRVPVNVAKNFRMGDAPHPHELPNVGESPGKYARMLSLVSLNPYSTTKSWATQTGEISPAQALGMIRKDPRYPMLNSQDFTSLTNNLKDRCRCYGFGAVVEVYEVQDALDDTFAEKGYGLEDGYDAANPFWSRVPLSNPHTLDGPEFPALDGLMDFDIAALMRERHAEREQFISADLRSFSYNASNVEHSVGNHETHQVSPVAPQTSNTPAYPQTPLFGFEPPAMIDQHSRGQIISESSNNYEFTPS